MNESQIHESSVKQATRRSVIFVSASESEPFRWREKKNITYTCNYKWARQRRRERSNLPTPVPSVDLTRPCTCTRTRTRTRKTCFILLLYKQLIETTGAVFRSLTGNKSLAVVHTLAMFHNNIVFLCYFFFFEFAVLTGFAFPDSRGKASSHNKCHFSCSRVTALIVTLNVKSHLPLNR